MRHFNCAQACRLLKHDFALLIRREFGEVLEGVTKAGRVVAVTSADKAKAANEQRPGFWDIVKVL